MRFSSKALITAVFALIAFVAVAPVAHADGGQLDAVGHDFTLDNFSVQTKSVDTTIQLGAGTLALLLDGTFGQLKTLTIISGATTYTFSDVTIKSWGLGWGNKGIDANIDFSFKGESTASTSVPEPATTLLIGCGLLGLAVVSSRKLFAA
jgi:PEP-CTERM motif